MPRALVFFVLLVCVACWGCKKGGGSTVKASTTETIKSSTEEVRIDPDPETNQDSSAAPSDTEVVDSTAEDLPWKMSAQATSELISFDDLKLGMEVDVKFRPLFLEVNDGRVKELFGKRVIVAGYMEPTDTMKGVKDFILLRNLECKFGPGGQADHLVRIYLAEGETTSFTDKIVYAEGELALNPYPADPQSPITWSIYDMLDAKVSTRRPSR